MISVKSDDLLKELDAILIGHWLTDLSNFSAFFFQFVENINWIGFYIFDGKQLRLGPFQGRPACTEIAIGRGVCGTAFQKNQTLNVPDTHEFPGHIACDERSRSELVIPLNMGSHTVGVLDIDSPLLARFSDKERVFFEKAVEILLQKNSQIEPALLQKMFSI